MYVCYHLVFKFWFYPLFLFLLMYRKFYYYLFHTILIFRNLQFTFNLIF